MFGGAIGVTPDFQLTSSLTWDADTGLFDVNGLAEDVAAGVTFPPRDNQRFS
jgi:hypothetical protein